MTKELKETLIYLLKQRRLDAEQHLDMLERWNDERPKESTAFQMQIHKQVILIKTLKSYQKELKQLK